MTRKILTSLLLFPCLSGIVAAQTTNAFRVNYNQALFDLPGNAVEALTPNNYVFAGTNMTFLPIYGTVTQVNETGALVWSKRYSDASIGFQLWDIKKDASLNEYYVCGGSESNAAVFMRIDATGNLVVSRKFQISQASSAFFNRVVKTSDGGYVAVGYVTGYDPDGAGPEIQYSPINYTDADGNSQTEYISSPLIVKMDANGNHLWHKVFRYYTNAAKDPATHRIYNDAAFNDVVETADGYVAVGQYDVNQHLSNTNSDGDDATPTDALILKTDFTGTIVYHKQYDAVSSSTTQSSKTLSAINKTSGGIPIAAGMEGSKEWIIKFAATGGWSPNFSRVFTFPGFGAVAEPSQIYEANGGADLITMGTYVNPFAFTFANYLHKSNSAATANVWTRSYTFSLLAILPRGSQVSDNGNLLLSLTLGGTNYDYHLIKTDPDGNTPLTGCAATDLSPTPGSGPTTTADPFYNFWSGTVGSQTLSVVASDLTPTSNIQCASVPCTTPAAPTATATTQPDCSNPTGSVTLTGLPTSGTWTVTGTPSGSATGNTSSTVVSGLAPGNYTFTVSLDGCESTASNSVTINPVSGAPSAPVIGTVTQTTCTVSTGSVDLSGLPSSGTWTVTADPGGQTITGTGTTASFTGLAPGTYTFIVSTGGGGGGPVTVYSEDFDGNGGTGSTWGTLNQDVGAQGSAANRWYISDEEDGNAPGQCGTAGNNDQSLHVGSTTVGDLGAAYDASAPNAFLCGLLPPNGCPVNTNKRSSSLNINTIGYTGMTLNFNYIENGEGADDDAVVEYSTNGGTSWTQLSNTAKTPLCGGGQGQWTAFSAPLPASCENIANLRIAFRWQNDADGVGTDPSFAVDDITIVAPSSGGSCISSPSASVTIDPQPPTPTTPVVGAITQPNCTSSTGSVALSGLPPAGSWTITASPGGLTQNGTGTTATFTGLTASTNYTFTVTNAAACTSSSSTSAAINAVPTSPGAPVTGTITQPTCSTPTGSVALSGLPASGSWTITASPGGATQTGSGTTATFEGLTGGTSYTFTVTNDAGCTSTASTSAAISAAPTPPGTPITGTVTQPTCSAPTGSVALSGLPASGTWTITASPGALTQTGSGTTATFTGLTAGTNYTLTVTNDEGCTSTATSDVAINAVPGAPTAPVIGTITQPTCTVATGTVALSGLPASGTWTITGTPSGSATGTGMTTNISGLATGSYTFTVTNDLGCTSSNSLSAVINAQPSTPTAPILGTVTQPDCTTPTGSVVINGLPASGTWTITGSPSGSATGTGTSTTITGLAPGTSYTYTVTNDEGCTSSASTSTGVINAAPVVPTAPITGTVTQPTCTAPSGSVALSGLPASGTWTITASPGALTQTGSGTTATFTGLTAGTNYTFTVTNDAGCTSTVSSSVAINTVPGAPAAPTAGTVTQPTCAVPTGSFNVTSPLGAQYTYSIDGTTFQASTSFTGLAPGNYTITVLDNTSGCSSASVAQVTVNTVSGAPAVTLVASEDVTCNGLTDGSLEISISGGTAPYTIVWTPNVGSGTTLSNLAAGSYSVNVTDDLGCSTTASFTIDTPAALTVNGVSSNVICGSSDGSITTAVSGGAAPYAYAWTPNGESTSSLSGLAAGSYGVTVTDDNGCTATQSFNVIIVGSLPVNIDPEYTEIEAGESVVLTATGADNYTWSPAAGLSCTDCPNPTASPDVTTTYFVTATDDNGCTGGDTAVVVIKLPCGEIFVPTIFSPNGTGPDKNNSLCVFGTESCIEELIFEVYDRWGEKVFETTDITKCWDGNYKDKPMNSGIYVYRLYLKLWNNDEAIDVSGNTTLVR